MKVLAAKGEKGIVFKDFIIDIANNIHVTDDGSETEDDTDPMNRLSARHFPSVIPPY
jgi:hypothetical protein